MLDDFYRQYGKRLLDLVASSLGLLILFPFLLGIIIIAAICNGNFRSFSSIFFIQERPGLRGQLFKIIKLKTMRDTFDAQGQPLPDEERLTTFGNIVRKFSLDELFQLINVLKGDMSLIGPRPLLVQYLPLYSPYEKRRHEALPGISGLAQVKGRNALSWRRRFRYDVFYVDHISLAFDLQIIWWTLRKIAKADGIMPEGQTTTEYTFRGSSPQSKKQS